MAYEGLMEFVRHLQSVPQIDRHLRHIHFVNIDRETTCVMANVMKSLYEQRQMLPSERVDKADEKAKVDYCVNGREPGGNSSSNYIEGSSVRQPRQAVTESVDRGQPNTADNRKSDVLMPDDYHNNLSSVRETTDKTARLKHAEASLKPPKRRELKKDDNVGVTETDGDNSSAVGAVAGGDKEEPDGLKHGEASLRQPSDRAAKTDDCMICLEPISDPKELDCGHTFCLNCIAEYFDKGQPKCPSCGTLFGVLRGNQPHGTFTHRCVPQLKLSGYEHHGALEITYDIPNGVQTVSNTQNVYSPDTGSI